MVFKVDRREVFPEGPWIGDSLILVRWVWLDLGKDAAALHVAQPPNLLLSVLPEADEEEQGNLTTVMGSQSVYGGVGRQCLSAWATLKQSAWASLKPHQTQQSYTPTHHGCHHTRSYTIAHKPLVSDSQTAGPDNCGLIVLT